MLKLSLDEKVEQFLIEDQADLCTLVLDSYPSGYDYECIGLGEYDEEKYYSHQIAIFKMMEPIINLLPQELSEEQIKNLRAIAIATTKIYFDKLSAS